MTNYILSRLAALILVLLGLTLVVFINMQLIPGDVAQAMLGVTARPEDLEQLRHSLGLDQPLLVQYLRWLQRLLQGDLGMSLQYRSPVLPLILERFQNTLILALASILLATTLGVGAGVVSATRPRSVVDRTVMMLALFGNSMPYFWLGLMAIVVFSLHLGWFPSGGMWPVVGDRTLGELARHLLLPAATLGVSVSAVTARMTRASMLEVVGQDYIRTAQAKGLPAGRILTRHALKNALLPILTVVGMQFGFLLGGAVLTETIFAWPGLGFTLFGAISYRDYPLVQGSVLVVATAFVLLNLAVDIMYAYVDPRIHYR